MADNNRSTQDSMIQVWDELNQVKVRGKLEMEFEFSHISYGERFFKTRVAVMRKSGTEDYIPVIVSEQLKPQGSNEGKTVELEGTFRSKNMNGEDGRNHLEFYVFAYCFTVCGNAAERDYEEDINYIRLDGNICRPTVLRQTPLGRVITDMMIAVKRPRFNKSDYIPCIAWGRIAQWVATLDVGTHVTLSGRIQSRLYEKEGEIRETFEVSIFNIRYAE